MPKNLISFIGCGLLATMAAGLVAYAQVPRDQRTPPLAIDSLTGRDSFEMYCATCHGVRGTGDGTIGAALRTRPADLTTLASRNRGVFPRQQVAAFVEGAGRTIAAHGSADMPVWGSVFRALERSDARAQVRIRNLVAYIESMQVQGRDALASPTSGGVPSGAELFRANCASCHGANARGGGPVSSQLVHVPPDLTKYTAQNGGVFPSERLRQIVAGRGVAAHGERNMPVWGEVFKRKPGGGGDEGAQARIEALIRYLEAIQERGAD